MVTRLFPRSDGELSAAQTSGIITPGDRIISINGVSVCDIPFKQAREILENAGRPCTIVFKSSESSSPNRKSKVKSQFRNSRKTQILREINSLSMILQSEKSPAFNVTRERLKSLETQIDTLRKTLDIVQEEIANDSLEYEKIKKQTEDAFEKLSEQIKPLLAQKKLLVKEVHIQRSDIERKKRDTNLYKHALIGVEKEAERIRQERITATGRDGEIDRAIHKSIYSLIQKREELKEIVNTLMRIFNAYDDGLKALEHIVQIWNNSNDANNDNKNDSNKRNSSNALKKFFTRSNNNNNSSKGIQKTRSEVFQDIETIVVKACDKLSICNDMVRYLDRIKGISNTAQTITLPARRAYQQNNSSNIKNNEDEKYLKLSSTIELLNHGSIILKDSALHFLDYCRLRMKDKPANEYLDFLRNRLLQISQLDGITRNSWNKLQSSHRNIRINNSQKGNW